MKTNEKDIKQGVVPSLRFPEFSEVGEWAIITLNKLASRIIKKNNGHICRVLTNSATDGVVDQTDYFDRNIVSEKNLHNYYVIENGDYVYNPRISTSAPVGPISKNYIGQGVMSPLYTIFRFHNDHNEFYNQYFKTKHWHKYLKNITNQGARFDRINITTDDFMNMPLPAPCQKEQQKIAACLSSIDALIKATENKINELKAHKKGLMQQLFPADGKTVPQYRFPEFRDAGEWKSYAITNFFSRLTLRNNENNDNILTISAQYGLVSQKEYFNKLVASENISNYFLLHKGDFAYNKSSSQAYPQGAIKCLKLYDKGIVSPLYICLKIKDIYEVLFFEYFFEAGMINSEIKNIAQEGARNHGLLNVGVKDFFNQVSFTVPKHFEERKKIADCLSSVDDLITAQTNRLEALKAHKKGLMQQLFPNTDEC